MRSIGGAVTQPPTADMFGLAMLTDQVEDEERAKRMTRMKREKETLAQYNVLVGEFNLKLSVFPI